VNATRLGWHDADRPARLRLAAETYGLDAGERREMVDALHATIAAGGELVRRRSEAHDPRFVAMWNEMGGAERFDRRRR
jgi:hypothetical protein